MATTRRIRRERQRKGAPFDREAPNPRRRCGRTPGGRGSGRARRRCSCGPRRCRRGRPRQQHRRGRACRRARTPRPGCSRGPASRASSASSVAQVLAVVVVGGRLAAIRGRVRHRRVQAVIQPLHHVGVQLGRRPDRPAQRLRAPRRARARRRPQPALGSVRLAEVQVIAADSKYACPPSTSPGTLPVGLIARYSGVRFSPFLRSSVDELVLHAQLLQRPVHPRRRAARPTVKSNAHDRLP